MKSALRRAGQSASQPNDTVVSYLQVPVLPGLSPRSREAFRRHYRDLVVGALLRSAEAQLAQQRAAQHRLRAWRAQRAVEQLRPLLGPPASAEQGSTPTFGPGLRTVTTVAWLAAGFLLIVDLIVFGIHSWTTSVGDAAMMALSLIWFIVNMGETIRQEAASERVVTVAADLEPAPEPRRQVFYFSKRDVSVSLDGDSEISLKAVTRAGEPVPLSAGESRGLADLLRRLTVESNEDTLVIDP